MPFEPIDTDLLNERPVTPQPLSREIPTSEVIGGFLDAENIVPNIAESFAYGNAFTDDVNYNAYEDMAGYEGYADELGNAGSYAEMTHRKQRIDERNEDMQNFADADGMQKFLAVGALIASDPTTLIPVGGAAYKTYRVGGRILEGGVKTAGIAAAVETGREALLDYNQDTRTLEDNLWNIGAATVVGGLLGGAAAGMKKADIDSIIQRYGDEMVTPEVRQAQTLGAGNSSVGAAQVATTMQQEEIKGLKNTKRLFNRIPSFLKNPVWEGATSNSKVMRDLTEKMSDLSLVKNKNTEGIASEQSVELGIKMYDTLRVPFYRDYNDAWKSYKTRAKAGLPIGETKLTRREFDEEIGKAMRRKDQSDIPEVAAAAQSARAHVFDPVLKRAEEAGIFKNVDEIDIKTADSWMKRVYDVEKIQGNRIEFKRRVLDWLRRERDMAEEGSLRQSRMDVELNSLAEEIIDRITNVTRGRIPYDHQIGKKGSFEREAGARGSAKQRVFAIPDEEIEDFLVSDVNVIMESHLRTMAPDNELMVKFGTLDFDVIKDKVRDDYDIIRNHNEKRTDITDKKRAKRSTAIEEELSEDIKNLEGMWQKLRGTYAQPDDYTAPAHVLERTGLAWNFVRLLGDVVASSVPDMGRQVMVHGFNRSYGALFKSVMQDVQGLKMAANEMAEIGVALDITNSMTALRRANMDEYVPTTSKIDSVSQGVAQTVATATGINHWNAMQKTFAGVMSQNRMLEAIETLGKGGDIPAKELENLASHGIDKAMAKRIAGQFAEKGETRKVLRIANAREWGDTEAKNIFQAAVRKQVDEIIVTPGLDRPLWLSRAGWRTIGQFKSFSFASSQRVMMAGLQQADANAMAGLTASTFLGSMVYAYKTKMRGKEPSDDPRVWITEGIDRSGVAGWFFDVNNMVEKATRGTVGINALTGGPPMSRYASRNVTGALLGPGFGAAQDVFQIVGGAFGGDFSASDTHAARRLMPGQNIPYLRGMFDKVEDGANSALGISK
jgi:hypothetical protein